MKTQRKNAIHFNNKTNVALFVMLVIKVSLEKSARLSSFVRMAHECFQNEIGRWHLNELPNGGTLDAVHLVSSRWGSIPPNPSVIIMCLFPIDWWTISDVVYSQPAREEIPLCSHILLDESLTTRKNGSILIDFET